MGNNHHLPAHPLVGSRARRRLRIQMLVLATGLLACAMGLVLFALKENVRFFYGPTDIRTADFTRDRTVRLGGLVEYDSLRLIDDSNPSDASVRFRVTDQAHAIEVRFQGILPDLFREGQGVVILGQMHEEEDWFKASQILAKHDENYMPAELVDRMKQDGTWRGGSSDGNLSSSGSQ